MKFMQILIVIAIIVGGIAILHKAVADLDMNYFIGGVMSICSGGYVLYWSFTENEPLRS